MKQGWKIGSLVRRDVRRRRLLLVVSLVVALVASSGARVFAPQAAQAATGDGFIDLPGTTGNYVYTPSVASLNPPGDMDVRVDVALDGWTSSQKLVSKLGTGYEFLVRAPGNLSLAWYAGPGQLRSRNSTVLIPATAGQRLQVRAVLDADNGASQHVVTFFYRTNTDLDILDNSSWTQLGTPVTTAGVTQVQSSFEQLTLGSGPGGTSLPMAGGFYQMALLNGVTTAADVDFRSLGQLSSTPPNYGLWTDTTGKQWTVTGSGWTYSPPAVSNQAPVGLIDSPEGPTTVFAGQSVVFAGSGTDPDGDPMTYHWDFGGSGIPDSTNEDPGAVTFANEGIFDVTFTVTDDNLASDPSPAVVQISVLPAFSIDTVFSGFTLPTAVEFSPDGRVFVAEKAGRLKVFDDLDDATATTVIDIENNTNSYWDRGLLGMALDPGFPTDPYVYLLYSLDIGDTWNDGCPTPPGGNTDGCVVNNRLSRFEVDENNQVVGSELTMLEGYWCQQYPSHSAADLKFAPDGMLLVSAGEGGSITFADYGQGGGSLAGTPTPKNPCGDPPAGVGGTMTPPTAEGGSLRSQDLLTSGDPISYDGAVLRIDPDTFAAPNDNPISGSGTADEARIIAHGLRNPYRMTIRPGTSEVWVGDVGNGAFEEINRIVDPTDGLVENFGWPCYEGLGRTSFDAINIDMCESLYNGTAGGPSTLVAPFYHYAHGPAPDVSSCPGEGASTSGLAFYESGHYPAAYNGALFFADYAHGCVWVAEADGSGLPDFGTLKTFLGGTLVVDLIAGPGGDIFMVDIVGGRVLRATFPANNVAPVAAIAAVPSGGPAPLTVDFDASGSSDAEGDYLRFAWDLDDDGQYDDATGVAVSHTFVAGGTHDVGLRVTDDYGAVSTTTATIVVTAEPTANDDAYAVDEGATLVVDGVSQPSVLANDTDPESDPLTAQLVTPPTHDPAFTLDPDGTFTYVHDGSEVVTDTFTYQATDGIDTSNVATVTIAVNPVNDAPVLAAVGDQVIDEEVQLGFTASATDVDLPGDTLSFSLANGASGSVPPGASIGASSGVFSWTPTEAQGPGTYTFDVVVKDNGTPILEDRETITVTVNDVNEPPAVTNPGPQNAAESDAVSLQIVASDSDVPAGTLSYSASNLPPSLTIDSATGLITGSVDFAAAQNSPYTVTVTVTDDGTPVQSTDVVFQWVVSDTNRPPAVTPIAPQTVDEGVQLQFTASASDPDPDNTLTFTLEDGADPVPAGAAIDPVSGVFTWTPAESQGPGTFSFFVRATDDAPSPLFDQEAVSITVNEVNVAPVAGSVPVQDVDEGQLVAFTVPASDADVPANTLTFSLVSAPPGATIGSTTGAFAWTPTETDGPGTYVVTVRVEDNGSPVLADQVDVTINVAEANTAPVLTPVGNFTVDELAELTFTASATDSDVPANGLSFSLDGGAGGAVPSGATIDPISGAFSWTPAEADGPGVFTFDVVVTDDGAPIEEDRETITITVDEVNTPPDASIVLPLPGFTWHVGEVFTHDASVVDADLPAQTMTYLWELDLYHCETLVDCHTHFNVGTSIDKTGQFVGEDHEYPSLFELTLTVTDQYGAQDVETLQLNPETVTLLFDAIDEFDQAVPGIAISVFVEDHLTPFSQEVIVGSTNSIGMSSPQQVDGTDYYFSAWSTGGAQSHDYTAPDPGDPACCDVILYVTTTQNTPPTGVDDAYSVDEGATLVADGAATPGVLDNDTDPDSDPLQAVLVTPPVNAAAFSLAADGTFTYQHDGSETTSDSFVYRPDDGSPGSTATVTITVNPVNDPPVLDPIGDRAVNEETELAFTATASDPDLPANTLTFSLDGGAGGSVPAGAAIDPTSGAFTWTPTAAQGPATYTFDVVVTDDGTPNLEDRETITVTVTEPTFADGYLELPGTAGAYIATPHKSQLSVVADIDMRADVAMDDWGTQGKFISKLGGSYEFLTRRNSGRLSIAWYRQPTGFSSSNSTEPVPFGPGERAHVRVTLDVDDGDGGNVVTFWYRTDTTLDLADDTGWVQLGSPIIRNGVSSIRSSGSEVALGADVGGNGNYWPGAYYQAMIISGLDATSGLIVADADFRSTAQLQSTPPDYSTWVDPVANVWTAKGSGWTYVLGGDNAAPVLDPIGPRSTDEGSALTFTATATDGDVPPNNLTFSLAAGPSGAVPAGASIDPSTGAFTWTPTEAQGPGTHVFDVVVTDDGSPPLTDRETITVTVREVNQAPLLGAIGDRTVDEGQLLTFTASATDADLPANTLTYSLDPGASGAVPPAASIGASSGVFSWTPGEADGPGTFTFDVVVTDNGTPPLEDRETIVVTVNDANQPPVLAPIGPKTVVEETELSFTASATDGDVPPDNLTFSLSDGAGGSVPTGAVIDPASGAFSWTPTEAQGPATYTFDVVVTDDGSPNLEDRETITVTVTDPNTAAGYVTLPGTVGNYLSTPDANHLDIVGDIDIRADVAMDNWFTQGKLVSKLGNSYEFMTRGTTGRLSLAWYEFGQSLRVSDSTVPVPFGPGERAQVRATLDVDDGNGRRVVTFWYRQDTALPLSDDSGWVLLGAPISPLGTSQIRTSTSAVAVGSNVGGSGNVWPGQVYQAVIIDGLSAGSGAVVANLDLRTTGQLVSAPPDYSSWVDAAGNPWTINGTGWTYTTGGGNQPPIAQVTATPASGVAPLDVTFDASGSTDPGDSLTYAWDLDDDGQFDDGTGVTIQQTLATPGVYRVSVEVTDSGGLKDTESVTVNVFADGGNDGFVTLPGVNGNYVSAPDANRLDIVGDIDIRVDVAMDNWFTQGKLVSKLGESYEFMTRGTTGRLSLAWYELGGALRISDSTAAVPFSAGERAHVRVTLDVDNGNGRRVVSFSYRLDTSLALTDDTGWVALGASLSPLGVSSIRASTSPVAVGANVGGNGNVWPGNVYQAAIVSGLNAGSGTVAANLDLRNTAQLVSTPPNYASWLDGAGNSWTVNGTGWSYTPPS